MGNWSSYRVGNPFEIRLFALNYKGRIAHYIRSGSVIRVFPCNFTVQIIETFMPDLVFDTMDNAQLWADHFSIMLIECK